MQGSNLCRILPGLFQFLARRRLPLSVHTHRINKIFVLTVSTTPSRVNLYLAEASLIGYTPRGESICCCPSQPIKKCCQKKKAESSSILSARRYLTLVFVHVPQRTCGAKPKQGILTWPSAACVWCVPASGGIKENPRVYQFVHFDSNSRYYCQRTAFGFLRDSLSGPLRPLALPQ